MNRFGNGFHKVKTITLFFFLISFLSTSSAVGQSDSTNWFVPTISVGVNFSSYNDRNNRLIVTDKNKIAGISINISGKLYFFKRFFGRPYLSFIQKGGDNDQTDVLIFDSKLGFIEGGMMLGIEQKIWLFRMYVNGGIYGGKKIVANETFGGFFLDRYGFEEADFDRGYIYGGGISIDLNHGRLGLEVLRSVSQPDVRVITGTGFLSSLELQNKSLIYSITYSYLF